jgi:hypothetical protein
MNISVYHVSPWRRWMLWLVVGPILLFLMIASAFVPWQDAKVYLITAALLFLVLLPFDWLVRWTRLELSPNGVRLRQFAYTLDTAWSNIGNLSMVRGREGFVTKEPMSGKGAARLAAFRGPAGMTLFDREQRQLVGQRRFIPIEAFAWHIRHGNLGADIARFAPDLKPAVH